MNEYTRKDEVVLHRVRVGHTRLTHSYLMEDPNKIQPQCFYCNTELISMKHLLLDCQHFNHLRREYFITNSMKDLFESFPLRKILGFLREAGLYNMI